MSKYEPKVKSALWQTVFFLAYRHLFTSTGIYMYPQARRGRSEDEFIVEWRCYGNRCARCAKQV